MKSLWANLFRRTESADDMYALLQRVPLFESLSRRESEAIERILYRRTYQKDETIFHQDEPGVGMYIIAKGAIHITFGPERVLLAELGPGDFFGEIALLNETPRSATATAQTLTQVYGFFRPDLLSLLERDPRLGVKVLLPLAQITGQRLLNADHEYADLHQKLEKSQEESTLASPQSEVKHGDGR